MCSVVLLGWMDRSGSRVVERGLGCRKISQGNKDGWTEKERFVSELPKVMA